MDKDRALINVNLALDINTFRDLQFLDKSLSRWPVLHQKRSFLTCNVSELGRPIMTKFK